MQRNGKAQALARVREGESWCVRVRNTHRVMKAVQTELRLDFMEIKSTNCCSYTHSACTVRNIVCHMESSFCVTHSLIDHTESKSDLDRVCVRAFFPHSFCLLACSFGCVLRYGWLEHSFLFYRASPLFSSYFQ